MILGYWSADELQTKKVSVRLSLRPDDLRMLDRLVIRSGSNTQRTHLPDRHAHVDCNPQATNARIDRQTGATDRTEQIDLGIEHPTARASARAAVDRHVCSALRKDGCESFGNGYQSVSNVSKTAIRD